MKWHYKKVRFCVQDNASLWHGSTYLTIRYQRWHLSHDLPNWQVRWWHRTATLIWLICSIVMKNAQLLKLFVSIVRFSKRLTFVLRGKSSCWSTDSKRMHRCCHLPNNCGSCWIGRKMPLHNCLFFCGDLGPQSPPDTWFLRSTRVHTAKAHLDWFSHISTTHGRDQHTHRPRYIWSNAA